jgi:hypothetical protein
MLIFLVCLKECCSPSWWLVEIVLFSNCSSSGQIGLKIWLHGKTWNALTNAFLMLLLGDKQDFKTRGM